MPAELIQEEPPASAVRALRMNTVRTADLGTDAMSRVPWELMSDAAPSPESAPNGHMSAITHHQSSCRSKEARMMRSHGPPRDRPMLKDAPQ